MLALLTVQETAEQLHVHEDTVRRLIARGELRCVRVARTVRIDYAELAAYVRRGHPAAETQGISPGQLRALHAKAADLDRRLEQPLRTSKREALAAASSHFRRPIKSGNDLSDVEATWVLDLLETQLEAAQ